MPVRGDADELRMLPDAIRRQNWAAAESLATAAAGAACRRWAANDSVQNLPLHLACVFGAPPAVVAAVLAVHRGAALQANALGHLPLHLAARNCGAKLEAADAAEVVGSVLGAYPAAARAVDGDGNHPLHLAAAGGARIAVVQLLLAEYPAAISAAGGGRSGATPLLLAIAAGAEAAVLEQLLAAHLEACRSDAAGDGVKQGGRLVRHTLGNRISCSVIGPADRTQPSLAPFNLTHVPIVLQRSLLALRDAVPQQVVVSLVGALYELGDAAAPALGLALNLMTLQVGLDLRTPCGPLSPACCFSLPLSMYISINTLMGSPGVYCIARHGFGSRRRSLEHCEPESPSCSGRSPG